MVKRRVKLTFRFMKRVWKTVKCQGKIRERSGNFEVADKYIRGRGQAQYFHGEIRKLVLGVCPKSYISGAVVFSNCQFKKSGPSCSKHR